MDKILKVEEAAMFLFGIYLFTFLHFQWWWFAAFILAPDLSMIGYAMGNKVGAICYNIFHHKAVALLVYIAGAYLKNEAVQFAGLILFSHASMDRMLGYGLKKYGGFKFTHLGVIGK